MNGPDIKLSAPVFSDREKSQLLKLVENPLFVFEPHALTAFSDAICEKTGFKHAYSVASGTAALHLALIINGVGSGDKVWTTSMTFMGGVSPVVLVGAEPVFVDVSPDSWTFDCDILEEELEIANKANDLPKAIIPTDLYGQSSDLDRLIKLCDRFGIILISDSAEGLGARYKDRHAGKGAKTAILSFNANKIITACGGGMILSDEEWIVAKASKLANQAREKADHYEHEEIGFNYRMSPLSAAFGLAQLASLDEQIERRRQIFSTYQAEFTQVDGVAFMPEPSWSKSTRWLSCITIDPDKARHTNRELLAICNTQGIETRPLWKPMHMQPVFRRMGVKFLGSGYCEFLFERGLCLPSGSGLSQTQHQSVVEVIKHALN